MNKKNIIIVLSIIALGIIFNVFDIQNILFNFCQEPKTSGSELSRFGLKIYEQPVETQPIEIISSEIIFETTIPPFQTPFEIPIEQTTIPPFEIPIEQTTIPPFEIPIEQTTIPPFEMPIEQTTIPPFQTLIETPIENYQYIGVY
jgi:hypothetical protein